MMSCDFEEKLEEAYWLFDAMHKGYAEHAGQPKTERDAFKVAVRALLSNLNKE